ncbi:MAG: T9SS type A sorting domain-containing protein [Bacteroidetes bacterium]|nr:T9SS type A sorting domain-containing protein [Bacteroidota bacterium]
MLKKNLIALCLMITGLNFSSFSQTYNMGNDTVSTCSGIFYDSGGPLANYYLNQNLTMTFNSSNGNRLLFNFSSLSTVYNLNVYDGNTLNAPLIGSYSGVLGPFSVQSSGTSLTFRFITGNVSAQSAGWAATISCSTPVLAAYPLNNGQTVTACNGIFYDDGGADSLYAINKTSTMTFCPTTSNDYLIFNFPTQFELASGDTLFVYSGSTASTAPIGVYVGSNVGAIISSPQAGACITFKFISDGVSNTVGWEGIMTCSATNPRYTMNMVSGTIPTCGGLFYDNGGPTGNYKTNSNSLVTFNSSNGNRLLFNFSSLSTVYNLNVYDGNTLNAPLIGSYSGVLGPFSVQSSGTSLTFRFITGNVSAQSAGWAATISCSTPVLAAYPLNNGQTVTACNGIFYDDGGADSLYAINQTSTMTFCPTTSNDYLIFNFPTQFELASGDTLFVYSGSTASTAPIGVYVGSNVGAIISSPQAGACITFKFISDGVSNTVGWEGIMTCSATNPRYTMNMVSGTIPTCGGLFYDNGGPTGNYKTNSNSLVTFNSSNGNRLLFNFSSLSTVYNLNVYDGNTLNAPLIGSYSGVLGPFSVQSSGTALTFQFITGNVSAQSAGWAATISCSTPVLTAYPLNNGQTVTACDGIFYDDGGADSFYALNQTSTMTFCPTTSNDYLIFNFPNQFELASGDTLFVYSGSTASTAPIGVYVGSNVGAIISSPQAGACITFKFISDGVYNTSGWQGIMTCSTFPVYTMSMISGTINTCGGLFYDSGGPNLNYKLNSSHTVTFNSTSGCSIKFDFSSLTTTYGLNAYDGTTTAAPLIGSYGSGIAPFTVQSSGSSITFQFITGNIAAQSMGWGASISCPGTTSATIAANGPSAICYGDSLVLTANSAASYSWNTGDTTQSIIVKNTGLYFVTITNNLGCVASSPIYSLLVNTIPTQPVIQQSNNSLICGAFTSYQWYLNSGVIIGADSMQHVVTQNGSYTVQVTDSNGCKNISAPFNFNSVGINQYNKDADLQIVPNPNSGRFKISLLKKEVVKLTILNLLGDIIYETEPSKGEIVLPMKLIGIYLLRVQIKDSTYYKKIIFE